MFILKRNGIYFTCVMFVATLLLGCSKQESVPATVTASAPTAPPAPTATPVPTPKALASTDGDFTGITVVVQELKRGPNALMLKLRMMNRSQETFDLSGYKFEAGTADAMDYGSIGAVHLIDAANKRKYFVMRDAHGDCMCSRDIPSVNPGSQTGLLWAEFPLPPDDVQKITVEVPHFPPMEDVPISVDDFAQAANQRQKKRLQMKIRWLLLTLMIAVGIARGQQASGNAPPDNLPPGAAGRVLDLVFRVEDLGGRVESLQVKETDMEVRIDMAADVLFDFNKANILPKAQEALKQAAEIIRQKSKGTVRIEGHTDSIGSDARNQRLSERRAESVKSWFIREEGLGNVSFTTQGFGASKPAAPNRKPDGSDDPEGRQKNRRVEIVITKG